MKPRDYVADFDSAPAMLRATGRYLHGDDFPLLGAMPRRVLPIMEALGTVLNALPLRVREAAYIWSGWREAIAPERLGEVRAEAMARWAVRQYPRRRYPAAMIGSSNGAIVHLCVALGIPWLPQTVLIPVSRGGVHPDEPRRNATSQGCNPLPSHRGEVQGWGRRDVRHL